MPLETSKIREFRKDKLWTLDQLSSLTGISVTSLSKIERGGKVRPTNLRKIAKALGVDVHTLINDRGEKIELQKRGESADKFDDVAQKAQKIGGTSFFEIDTGTDSFGHAVSDLREIFNSGDQVIITAILANLFTFKRATRREQEIATLKSENQILQTKVQSLESRLAAVEEKMK